MPVLILLVPLFTGIADLGHEYRQARPAPHVATWTSFQAPLDALTLVQAEPEPRLPAQASRDGGIF